MAISSVSSFKSQTTFPTYRPAQPVSYQTQPVVAQPPVADKSKNSKAVAVGASAVALASLGFAGYALVKGRKNVKQFGELRGQIRNLTETLETRAKAIEDNVNTVKNAVESEVGAVKGELGSVKTRAEQAKAVADSALRGTTSVLKRPVEVNGQHLNLGTVMHGYGVEEEKLAETLRAESTKRILGAVKPAELPENAMIRVPTAEFTGFAKTGGLAVVPRELVANLGAVVNNKQKAELIVDTPMYLGQVENSKFFSIVRRADGKYDYMSKQAGKNSKMVSMEKIDEMFVPITTDAGRNVERVEVFLSDEMRQAVDLEDTILQFDKETADKIREALNNGKGYSTNLVEFIPATEKDAAKAEVKFRTVFYKNDKFRMDGPIEKGVSKNIYNDKATASGETERFTYFCKYMYENLLSSAESSTKPLRADWIIGNDWHTGALAAMTRLLTPAKKAMGLEPELADKIQNTPITTLMHNFKLQGAVGHSQDKLLNIMFGEHAAKIAENAWMPQKADLPSHLMNGLFSGNALNPQTMAMTYADDIVFVSRGNFNEAANVAEFGGTNHKLAALRGRVGEYANKDKLDNIAMASSIKPETISTFPTAKGITNGCDRVNNILTPAKARKLEEALGLPEGALLDEAQALENPFRVHQHNKRQGLNVVIRDLEKAKASGGKDNPLKIKNFEQTDLTGVDENTLVFGSAGRIVDQKGLDNTAEGILKFYKRGNYDKANPPVCYFQGTGDDAFVERLMAVKNEVRKIDPKAADRILFAGVFSEPGRYDCCKLISDFSPMHSWDEPCGLVHKEIGYMSGSISFVNKRGGLTDGLNQYVKGADNSKANSVFVDFMDKETHSYEEAIEHNGNAIADGMETISGWFKDKESFAQGIKNSYTARFDWLRGKVQEYVEIGKRHGVLSDKVDSAYVV